MRHMPTGAEFLGLATAFVLFLVASLSGIDVGLSLFLAVLMGLAMWAAARVYLGLVPARVAGARPHITTFVFVLIVSTTGLIIQGLEFDRSLTVLISLFFLCGVSIGLAFGLFFAKRPRSSRAED